MSGNWLEWSRIRLARGMLAGSIATLCTASIAQSLTPDIFRTERGIPNFAMGTTGAPTGCDEPYDDTRPLSLRDALDRGMCTDPKVRSAWADIKQKAAQLGQAEGAYLPTISGNYQAIEDHSETDVHGHPSLSSSNHSLIQTVEVSANLIIWDFGSRSAATRAARELLIASQATWRGTLQTEYARIAKDYFGALGAAGTAHATHDAADAAKKTLDAAKARIEHGVAPVSDLLQAQTSLEQAAYDAEKADSVYRAAVGLLAIDIGRDPVKALPLPQIDATEVNENTLEAVRVLLDTVDANDPGIVSAEAQFNAAQAELEKVRDDGLPVVSVVSKYTRNNQPASLGLGVSQFPATGHDWYFGVQVRIPIFEGFVRNYQIREARAKVETLREGIRDARRQAASGVWSDYEALIGSAANVQSTGRLLVVAERSFEVATTRYQMGAGSILEVLNAQTSLARARRQRVESLATYGTSSSQLAARIGALYDRGQ